MFQRFAAPRGRHALSRGIVAAGPALMRQLSLFDGVPSSRGARARSPRSRLPSRPRLPRSSPGSSGCSSFARSRWPARRPSWRRPSSAPPSARLWRSANIFRWIPTCASSRTASQRWRSACGRWRETLSRSRPWAGVRSPGSPGPASGARCCVRRLRSSWARHGDRATVGGAPVGALFLEAGALDEAERSLGRALAVERTAPLLFPLADTLFEQGEDGGGARGLPGSAAVGCVRPGAARLP
jgi:hypothetical protein